MYLYLLIEAPVANLDKALLSNIKILPFPKEKPVIAKTNADAESGDSQQKSSKES